MAQTSTSEHILFALKSRGAMSAKQVAEAFSISVMGAHKALNSLGEQDLVRGFDRIRGRGRPTRLFALTAKGHGRFPDNHAELSVEVIGDIQTIFGADGMDRIISAREERQRARYLSRVKGDLGQRSAELARLRTEEGYMARAEADADGSVLLIEDHCPICAAAKTCQGFCRSELNIFREALGGDFSVEREEHLLSGGRRCTYRIRREHAAS